MQLPVPKVGILFRERIVVENKESVPSWDQMGLQINYWLDDKEFGLNEMCNAYEFLKQIDIRGQVGNLD